MPADVRHPVFARFFDRLSRVMEPEMGPWRQELVAGLSGRVLELGPGNGINFRRYPSPVTEVVAIEPEPYMRTRAEEAAAAAPVPITVRAGAADALELEPGSCDAAVICLVLCSVPNQPSALAELHRVLKPQGALRFLEHVRSPGPRKARLQLALDRSGLWPLAAGGCHCSRDTVTAIAAAGFEVEQHRPVYLGPSWLVTNPHVVGRASASPQPEV